MNNNHTSKKNHHDQKLSFVANKSDKLTIKSFSGCETL